MNRRIGALIVTYQPDLALLRRSLQAVAPQVDHGLLIDNASSTSPEAMLAALDQQPRTLQDLLRFSLKLFWFGLVSAPRRENLRMILRGTWDGWRGRLGPFPDP